MWTRPLMTFRGQLYTVYYIYMLGAAEGGGGGWGCYGRDIRVGGWSCSEGRGGGEKDWTEFIKAQLLWHGYGRHERPPQSPLAAAIRSRHRRHLHRAHLRLRAPKSRYLSINGYIL